MRRNLVWKGLLAEVALIVFLVYGGIFFLGAGHDDCFITYWSALNVAQGRGLVNYNYEPAEISSSLIHVVILAIWHHLSKIDMFMLGRICGIAAGGLCLIWGILAAPTARSAALYAAALLSCHGFIYWSFGGLETPLVGLAFLIFCLGLADVGPRAVSFFR